jgi:hypothetical protein
MQDTDFSLIGHFFAPPGEKMTGKKKKSTTLPQARSAFAKRFAGMLYCPRF